MTSSPTILYAHRQRAHHTRQLSRLGDLVVSIAPEMMPHVIQETKQESSSLLPRRVVAYTPLQPQTEHLESNGYISFDAHLEHPSPSIHTSALGLTLPYPPQANINDMDSMFGTKLNPLDGTLPMMPDRAYEGGVYGYPPVAGGHGTGYPHASGPSYSNGVGGVWNGQSSLFSIDPNNGEQVFLPVPDRPELIQNVRSGPHGGFTASAPIQLPIRQH